VTLSEELIRIKSIFIDTAPIIYYMEAHPQFGPLARFIENEEMHTRDVWIGPSYISIPVHDF
jgi:hypothetical protein